MTLQPISYATKNLILERCVKLVLICVTISTSNTQWHDKQSHLNTRAQGSLLDIFYREWGISCLLVLKQPSGASIKCVFWHWCYLDCKRLLANQQQRWKQNSAVVSKRKLPTHVEQSWIASAHTLGLSTESSAENGVWVICMSDIPFCCF